MLIRIKILTFLAFAVIGTALLLMQYREKEFSEKTPVVLFGEFKSYQSINEVNTIIERNNYNIKVFENSSLPPNGTRPEFSNSTIDIYNYKTLNLNHEIKLRLKFLNNKLHTVIIFSDEKVIFDNEFDREAILKLTIGKCINVRKNIQICKYDGYFSFDDKRITEYINHWISKWSFITTKSRRLG